MRIGVIEGKSDKTSGGAWTFTSSVVTELKSGNTRNHFLLLDEFLEEKPQPAVGTEASSDGKSSFISPIRSATRFARRWPPVDRLFMQLVPPVDRSARRLIKTIIEYRTDRGESITNKLNALIQRFQIDVIWLMSPSWVVPPTPVFPSVPFIATVWDLEHRKQPYFPEVNVTGWSWRDREQYFINNLPLASFIITGTEAGKNEIVHYYRVNPENVKVVPYPVPELDLLPTPLNRRALNERYGICDDFIFYPAQYWPHKNHVNLFRALKIIKEHHGVRLRLVITGSDRGNGSYLQDCILHENLAEEVFELGFVSREELSTLYKHALALVFPSFFGPDNIPPLEAFSLGCPVLASRIPGAEEQLRDGALLFDPKDPHDIASKIMKVHSDAGLRSRLIEEGAKIGATRSSDRYVSKIDELLTEFEAIRRCWGSEYIAV